MIELENIWKEEVLAQSRQSRDICFERRSKTTKTLRLAGVVVELRTSKIGIYKVTDSPNLLIFDSQKQTRTQIFWYIQVAEVQE
jgi:hypothetical protein